jgi:hypothetical protein
MLNTSCVSTHVYVCNIIEKINANDGFLVSESRYLI